MPALPTYADGCVKRGSRKPARAAVLLFGNAYGFHDYNAPLGNDDLPQDKNMSQNMTHNMQKKGSYEDYRRLVDFRVSVRNYKKYLFKYLKCDAFPVDVFFSTNNITSTGIRTELLDTFGGDRGDLKDYEFRPSDDGRFHKLLSVVRMCMKRMREKKIIYERVIVTRFDLLFKKD